MRTEVRLKDAELTQEEIDNFPIIPYGEKLVVKEHKAEKIGHIYVPDTAQEGDASTFEGHVIAVGHQVGFVQVGDHVYYARYSGAYIPRLGDNEQKVYRMMNEEDLLGRVKEDR